MQGLPNFVPTDVKVSYVNMLLQAGFHTLDFGSFVSPKAIPQMRDTAEVVKRLDLGGTTTRLLAIVANERGAQDACIFPEISYLGFPFSISETFQQRNTNSSIAEALDRVKAIQALCVRNGKELVIYISMGFGNPYGDPWHPDLAAEWVERMVGLGISTISLADTVGVADTETIASLFNTLVPAFPGITLGAHLHSRPDNWRPKLEAAYANGCRRFDGALKGYGGCPMADDDLVGNMATENIIAFLEDQGEETGIGAVELGEAIGMADSVFSG